MALTGLLFAAVALIPQEARGQVWLQTSQVVTPIEQGPTRVLLDTLSNVIKRRNLKVRRSPDAKKRVSFSTLQSSLIEEEGIGIRSANQALINYRFSIDNGSNFDQEVASIHFLFRPGPNQSDISVFHVNAQKMWLDQLLQSKGTDLGSNEAALIPFRRHLGFANIARQEETQIVEIGGQTVREGFKGKKKALIRKVEKLTYESYV